jgi:oligopeptide transport system substrate-binding protein
LELFVSDSGNNYGQYENEEFDELVHQATKMTAGPDRYEVLRKAETLFITQDQAVIPVYHYVNKDMIDLDVWGGWSGNFTGRHEPKFIYKK